MTRQYTYINPRADPVTGRHDTGQYWDNLFWDRSVLAAHLSLYHKWLRSYKRDIKGNTEWGWDVHIQDIEKRWARALDTILEAADTAERYVGSLTFECPAYHANKTMRDRTAIHYQQRANHYRELASDLLFNAPHEALPRRV